MHGYKYSGQVQARGPSRDRCITQAVHAKCSGYPCPILYGYKYSARVQARRPSRDRCITPAVHAKCGTGTSTACELTHAARSVHCPGCSCHKLYVYKYNVRDQPRGPKRNQFNCTCTSIACGPKHVDLSTIGLSPRLSMPVHATGLRKSVHRLGCPCQNTVQVVLAHYVRASTSTHVYYAHRPGCPCSRRVVQHLGCTGRPPYIHI